MAELATFAFAFAFIFTLGVIIGFVARAFFYN